jgi:hypothetical protein
LNTNLPRKDVVFIVEFVDVLGNDVMALPVSKYQLWKALNGVQKLE